MHVTMDERVPKTTAATTANRTSRFELAPPRHFVLPAILLLLSEHPGYGYRLVKDLEDLQFGRIDRPSVYRALGQLENDQLVESWLEAPTAGQTRRVYGLTPLGGQVLRVWMGVIKEERDGLDRVLRRYQATGTHDAVLAEIDGGWSALRSTWSPVSSTTAPFGRRAPLDAQWATGRVDVNVGAGSVAGGAGGTADDVDLVDPGAIHDIVDLVASTSGRAAPPSSSAGSSAGSASSATTSRPGRSSGSRSGPPPIHRSPAAEAEATAQRAASTHLDHGDLLDHGMPASTSTSASASTSATPLAPGQARSVRVPRRFRLVAERSVVLIEVRSSVGPISFGAIGLAGVLEADVERGALRPGSRPSAHVEIAVNGLRSGNSLYDAELMRRIDARHFPTANLDLTDATAVGGANRFRLAGKMSFHGVTREVEGAVAVDVVDDRQLVVTGEQVFDIRDFDVPSPTVLMLRIYPDVRVRLHVEARLEE
jgi:DNA-binding PadR family transcriptional regulator